MYLGTAKADATSGGSSGTSVQEKSDGHSWSGKRWLGLEAVIVGGLVTRLFTSHWIIE